MLFSLQKKIALVTGAGSGIGEAIAKLYAKQGATVFVTDQHESAVKQVLRVIRAKGGDAEGFVLNVAYEESIRQVFQQVQEQYGRLDILVNNAGVSSVGTIKDTTLEEWERVMNINAKGVFLCSQAALHLMLSQRPQGGVFVNIASASGLIGVRERFAYSASKGAVISMTRALALDFIKQGIRANAICPGTVHTPFIEGYLESHYSQRKEEVRQELHARQPLGRMGLPEEIAATAVYLASDEASFVTGSIQVVDGGWTAQ